MTHRIISQLGPGALVAYNEGDPLPTAESVWGTPLQQQRARVSAEYDAAWNARDYDRVCELLFELWDLEDAEKDGAK